MNYEFQICPICFSKDKKSTRDTYSLRLYYLVTLIAVLKVILISMEDKIIAVLKKSREGLTIADLVRKLKASRFIVRNNLAKLETMNKVHFKRTGMAKVYFLNVGKVRW